MREYYLFYINSDIKHIYFHESYQLFNTLKKIYNIKKESVVDGYLILRNLVDEIEKKKLNKIIFNDYRDSDYYIKFQNRHVINNYYNNEHTELIINNTYLKLISSENYPTFFKYFNYDNVFVCDFNNKDYFWLNYV